MLKFAMVFTVLLSLLAACKSRELQADLQSQGRPKGTLKGYYQIENLLKTKLIKRENRNSFILQTFLTGSISTSEGEVADIARLLGIYEGVGDRNNPRNAIPNGMNTLLWYITLSKVAASIGENCHRETDDYEVGGEPADPHFVQNLQALCQFDPAQPIDETKFRAVWNSVMDYGLPEEEYKAWNQYLMEQKKRATKSEEFVAGVFLAMFFNPYFLLVN
jgi:hypothetical protein